MKRRHVFEVYNIITLIYNGGYEKLFNISFCSITLVTMTWDNNKPMGHTPVSVYKLKEELKMKVEEEREIKYNG